MPAAGGPVRIKRTGEVCGGGARGKRTGASDGVARIKRTMKAGTDRNEWGWQDYRVGRKPSGKIGGLKMKGGISEAWK